METVPEIDEASPSLNRELDTLDKNLQAIRLKFINDWATKATDNFISKMKHDCATLSEKGERDQAALQEEIERCKAILNDKSNVAAVHVQQQEALKQNLEEISRATNKLLHEKEQLEQVLKDQKDSNQKQREMLSSQAEASAHQRRELEKAATFFKDRLGLQFKKLSGGRLQLVFTCIDRNDPDRVFYFSVKINSDGTYSVLDVEPEVPGLEDLISNLNETNDFRKFVHSVRSKFKASV